MTLDEVRKLTDDELRIKVEDLIVHLAEACGFSGGPRTNWPIPDYPHDLNAMHEAEKVIPEEVRCVQYKLYLEILTAPDGDSIFATARQRAEAFVLTMKGVHPS